MRRIEVTRLVEAPPTAAWSILVDTTRWPAWGPSIRAAELDDGARRIHEGATGTVTTAVGIRLSFEITEWLEGERWAWDVARLPATGHVVRPLGDDRCEVVFEVPWIVAPYAVVCRHALGRIADLLDAGDSR